MWSARSLPTAAAVIVISCGCTPKACSDTDTRLARDVELLVAGAPGGADDAADRLVAAGAEAIAILETGLYAAEPPGRNRIVDVLVRIGDVQARPILEHLSRKDPDPGVRAAAGAGLEVLPTP